MASTSPDLQFSAIEFAQHGPLEKVAHVAKISLPAKPPSGHFYVSVKAAPINPSDELFCQVHYTNTMPRAGPASKSEFFQPSEDPIVRDVD